MGAIGNPVLHGYTLSATCRGTYSYKLSVELMPTGIATTYCSCPYSGEGNCKHIVALLLTYIHAPEMIYSVDTLIAVLAKKKVSDPPRRCSIVFSSVIMGGCNRPSKTHTK